MLAGPGATQGIIITTVSIITVKRRHYAKTFTRFVSDETVLPVSDELTLRTKAARHCDFSTRCQRRAGIESYSGLAP